LAFRKAPIASSCLLPGNCDTLFYAKAGQADEKNNSSFVHRVETAGG
jgi:hypothetical protein